MKRIMVRAPDSVLPRWKVDIVASATAMAAVLAFCELTFGPAGTPAAEPRHPWDHLPAVAAAAASVRWSMHQLDQLKPPWVELYFRDKADVALLALYDLDSLDDG